MQIRPRILDIKQPKNMSALMRPTNAELPELPSELLDHTGEVLRYYSLDQGRCSSIVGLNTERGDFVVKVTQGEYRGKELLREHQVMQDLQGLDIPVPNSIAFLGKGELAWQLREYRDGMTLRTILRTCTDSCERVQLITQMAAALVALHRVGVGIQSWEDWKEASLRTAQENMQHGLLDIAEEFVKASPEVELAWLKENCPGPGRVSLLHGDYRTKNLLYSNGKLVAVLDWAFADYGDPYYDLAIALDYVESDSEYATFAQAYGLKTIDDARLNWCRLLVKFLNI